MQNKIIDQFESLLLVFAELENLRAEVQSLKGQLKAERADVKS